MDRSESFKKFVSDSLVRHSNGDWGDTCKADAKLNDDALESGEDRLLSVYKFEEPGYENKIWIITEWDRSVTTILFPSEY